MDEFLEVIKKPHIFMAEQGKPVFVALSDFFSEDEFQEIAENTSLKGYKIKIDRNSVKKTKVMVRHSSKGSGYEVGLSPNLDLKEGYTVWVASIKDYTLD